MASFTVSWAVGSGTYEQELYLKARTDSTYQMIASVDETVNSYNINGLQNNKLYDFKVKTYCSQGTPVDSNPKTLIQFTCPVLTLTPVCSGTINYSFPHLGNSVDSYDVVLYTNAGTLITTQTKSVSATITGSFTGLAELTTYKVRVIPKASTESKTDCPQVSATTLPFSPVLVSSPSPVSVCDDGPNSTTTLTASFTGSNITYSWYRNGVLISNNATYSGATTNALTILLAGSVLGSFVCRATNACGFVETTPAVVSQLADTAIVTAPSIIPTCVTDPIVLSVTASGSSLTYQWQKSTDGGSSFNNIPGATSATYTLAPGSTEGDQYRVVVDSTCGPQLTSTAAVVDTVVTPTIDAQPTNQQACVGGSGTFTVAYTVEDPTTAIWQQFSVGNWVDIGGATSTTYTTTTLGNYRFKVANACGTVYSNQVTLTNYTNLSFTGTSTSASVCQTQSVTITNTVAGSNPSYQWSLSTDGGVSYNDVIGETTNSLVLTNIQYTQNGYKYKLTVTGPCNTISNVTTLTVAVPLNVSSGPSNQTVCAGDTVTFSVTATSGSFISYNWQTNTGSGWLFIAGATGSSYLFTAQASDNGYQYRAVVTSCAISTTTAAATLSVNTPVSMFIQPSSTTVCEGANASFTATLNGTITSYQWEVSTNGGSTWSNLVGATSNFLTISGTTLAQNGYQYRLVSTGPCNTVTSNAVTLTVNSTAATWVNRDVSLYYVCVGVDKYYQQIDTNPCSATYNTYQTGSLYQANSVDCGYVVCNTPTVTSTSMTYVAPCPCPAGYVSSPDLSECVQEVTVSATAPTASTFARTLIAKANTVYSNYQTVVYTGGFDPATGVPTGTIVTDTSAWWKNIAGNVTDGPMNRCAVWTNLQVSFQRIGFSICLNTTQDKTYLVGVGSDNFSSIKLNGTTVLTQDPSALGLYYAGNSGNLTQPFNIWHIYPIFIPAGNNVIEVSGNNVLDVCAVGVEIYDGTPAQILGAQSYTQLGQRLVFSTKDIIGTQVDSGTDGVGYTCPDSSYVIKSCGLPTPVCYKVLTAVCGS